jgi:hypothetical protein
MRRALLIAAALAIPASVVLMTLDGGQALAASGPKGKTVCSGLSGSTASGHVQLSQCVDANFTGGGTGGGTGLLSISVLTNGGPVTWNSGKVTTFGMPTLITKNAKHCPGYVKGGSSNPIADQFQGAIPTDNAGFKVPGKYKGQVCITSAGVISILKPLKIS